MSFITILLPITMIGTLMINPKTTKPILSFAAPAIATTLSRLITASAIIMVLIAPNNVVLASISCPLWSGSG